MKRLMRAALLAALVLCVGVSVVEAAGSVRYRSAGFVKFRTHVATIVGNEGQNYGTDASGGYVDSLGYYGPSNDVYDTSAVVVLPNDFCNASASDSMPPVVLVWRTVTSPSDPTSALFGSGDSTYVKIQPAVGQSFLDPVAGAPTPAMGAIAGANGFGIMEVFKAAPAGSAAAAQTFPRNVQVVPGFSITKEFRLIAYSDGTSAFTGARWVTCEVLYTVCQ